MLSRGRLRLSSTCLRSFSGSDLEKSAIPETRKGGPKAALRVALIVPQPLLVARGRAMLRMAESATHTRGRRGRDETESAADAADFDDAAVGEELLHQATLDRHRFAFDA